MKATRDIPVNTAKAKNAFTFKEAQAEGPRLIDSLRKRGLIRDLAAPAKSRVSHDKKAAR